MTKLYNVAQAADYLGCLPQTVRRRVESGKLRPARAEHRTNHVAYWFTKQALDEFEPVRAPQTSRRQDSVTVALRGVYRGPAMSDEQTASGYARWVKARRDRKTQGGAVTTR